MSLILQIETATTACSVALSLNGELIALKELNQRNIHAEVITLFIDDLLKSKSKSYSDLSAVAVSAGPGSYTGLRIGVSTAKGLCFALEKPLIAIETLEAMARGFKQRASIPIPGDALLCPMIDARRMEVFTAVFNQQGERIHETVAEVIDENSFVSLLDQRQLVFFGDGAGKCVANYSNQPNAIIVDDFVNSAADMSSLAYEYFKLEKFVDVAYYEPYYLKDFIAGKAKNS